MKSTAFSIPSSASKSASSKLIFPSRFFGHQGSNLFATQSEGDVIRLGHVEDDNRHLVVHAKAEGRGVHDLQSFGQRFAVSQMLVSDRVGKLHGILVVNAIHLGGLQDDLGANLVCSQRRGRVSRE